MIQDRLHKLLHSWQVPNVFIIILLFCHILCYYFFLTLRDSVVNVYTFNHNEVLNINVKYFPDVPIGYYFRNKFLYC